MNHVACATQFKEPRSGGAYWRYSSKPSKKKALFFNFRNGTGPENGTPG
jgi:hypothetical protein